MADKERLGEKVIPSLELELIPIPALIFQDVNFSKPPILARVAEKFL
jgi:hypothetical protein